MKNIMRRIEEHPTTRRRLSTFLKRGYDKRAYAEVYMVQLICGYLCRRFAPATFFIPPRLRPHQLAPITNSLLLLARNRLRVVRWNENETCTWVWTRKYRILHGCTTVEKRVAHAARLACHFLLDFCSTTSCRIWLHN
jgi:hypothetical protein